jgi:hypothetical protein
MSAIALILGANPKKSSGGPRVKLEVGHWQLVFQGVEQSTFTLTSTSLTDQTLIELRPIHNLFQVKAGYHTIKFAERGNESSISIYAVPLLE